MEEKSIAMAMLEELKKSSKRWFITAIIELIIIVGMIISYFVYDSQYEYSDEITQSVENTELNSSSINQNLGE